LETNIDFNRSFVTWLTANKKSHGRFNVECRVRVTNNLTGKNTSYFLLSGIMAGNVYSNSNLIKNPPYLYQAVISDKGDFKILRTFIDKTDDEIGISSDLFAHIDLNIVQEKCKLLKDKVDIREAVLSNKRLGAKIIHDQDSYSTEIDFPIKHINVQPAKEVLFQVETGPVLVHVKDSKCQLESLTLGYVFFSSMEQYECILSSISGTKKQRIFESVHKRKTNIKIMTYHES